MAPNQTIDYDALAQQNGAVSSAPPAQGTDYDALAKQNGATASLPPANPTIRRYFVSGQGVQEFAAGSTDEQAFLQRFPQAKVVSSYQSPVAQTIDTETPAERTARENVGAKHGMETAGAMSGAMLLPAIAPEAGVIGASALAGAGAGLGTMGGQAITGNNPLQPENLQTSAVNAATTAGTSLALGGAIKAGGALFGGGGFTVPAGKLNVTPPAAEMQPALANTPREILNYAAANGIDLTPGQATGSPVARTVQAIGERSLVGGDTLDAARQASAMKLAQNVRGIADTVDPQGLGISEENAGSAIQESVRNAQQQAHDAAQAAYQQLPQQFRDANVDLTKIRADYFQKLKQAEVSLANRNPTVAAQIQGALEQGANLGTPSVTQDGTPFRRPEMTVQDLLKVRSDAIQDGNALARAGAPNEVQGIYRGLASDVDGLIEQQSNQLGMTKQWRDANAGWKNYQAQFNTPSSPLYRIASQQDPAKVTRTLLANGSASDVDAMQKAGMTDGLQALQRQVITDIANRGFKVAPDGLGGYSDSFLQKLFGAQQTKELYLNGELARRMGFQVNPSGTSNVLLGADQLTPEPSKWMLPLGAARISMPRPAGNFLPSLLPAARTGATLGSLAPTVNQYPFPGVNENQQ
jgi:hypothetical protein